MSRQSWMEYIGQFYICETCGIVDNDIHRMEVGYPCNRCKAPSNMALGYFEFTIGSIADLISELYPLPDPSMGLPPKPIDPIPESHRLGILIYFCTLGEILTQHLLERIMNKQRIIIPVQKRLLQDNLFISHRIKRLFPSLTGDQWNDAIIKVSEKYTTDYESVSKFYIDAIENRNRLLHRGNKWAIPSDMADDCFSYIGKLLNLFIALHNYYVANKI